MGAARFSRTSSPKWRSTKLAALSSSFSGWLRGGSWRSSSTLVPKHRAINAGQRGTSRQRHSHFQLSAQDVDDAGHALLAAGGQAIDIWTSDEHGARAQRESFEHISAAAHAAIHQNGKAIAHAVGDARQSVNGGRHGVQIASTVVGNDDARHAGFGGNGGVIGIEYAFEQQRNFGDRQQPVNIFPSEAINEQPGKGALLGHGTSGRFHDLFQVWHLDARRQVKVGALLAVARAIYRR